MLISVASHEWKGETRNYKVANGTYFDFKTPDVVIRVLEEYRGTDKRLRVFYGDPETGRAWAEEHDTIGTIGRSTGTVKIPLLMARGDHGGPGLLTGCILAIRTTGKGKHYLYKHPKFDLGQWTATPERYDDGDGHRYEGAVYHDGELFARTTKFAQANNLAQFMAGWRDKK